MAASPAVAHPRAAEIHAYRPRGPRTKTLDRKAVPPCEHEGIIILTFAGFTLRLFG